MCTRLTYLISCVLVVALAVGAAVGGVAYPAPDEWWTYIYTGNTAGGALDGTWDHDNGSDQWDGSAIGSGGPGGVSALSEDGTNYMRLQDTGDPRSNNMPDPSNRKLYFTHQLSNEIDQTLADEILSVHGITISFRARIATGEPLDQIHAGGTPSAWPAMGDGYGTHDSGKSIFTVHQEAGSIQTISFAMALAEEEHASVAGYMGDKQGLLMNSLNGASPSGAVDAQDNEGTPNILEIDPIEWHEFWITIEPDETGTGTHVVKIYVDGSMEPSEFFVTAGDGSDQTYSYIALGLGATPQRGAIDVDFFAYKEGILTPADIYTASNPSPTDEAMVEDTWASLSWVPGASAASHDIYFGDNFDQVNEGIGETFRGNHTSTFFVVGFPGYPYPDGLVPGTTYYWRIDEVEADGTTIHKGNVWSFSIPPKTAYFPDPADGAELVDLDVQLSWTAGFGAKLHTVYFGEDFDEVNNAAVGIPQGTTTYTPGTLTLAKTYYWRVDEFDAAETHKGEIWSFTTEGAVSGPNPANGAVDVSPTQILTWDAGAVAASHEVYFGTDADAVKNATKSSSEYKGAKALGEESYDPGKLLLNTAYYWRIEEVNGTNPDSPWAGNVWSFTTGDFFVIDDFENYDVGNNEIWWSWKDGLGYGPHGDEPAYLGNGTGAAVGDETTASYTEETIVHGGSQSMPIAYDNNKQGYAYYSEVEHKLTDQRDWTEEGMVELSLWFYGDSNNSAELLYVAVSNSAGTSAVVVHDDPAAATIDAWTQWIIPLSAFADQGINLSNIDRIAIGLGTQGNIAIPGGSGKMYIDDIRLNQPSAAE